MAVTKAKAKAAAATLRELLDDAEVPNSVKRGVRGVLPTLDDRAGVDDNEE